MERKATARVIEAATSVGLVSVGVFVLYLFPSFVAYYRKHKNVMSFFPTKLFLG